MPPHDFETWMWSEACESLARAERLHRQFFKLGSSRAARPSWEPPVDLLESPSELVIQAALPGVRAEDIQISIEGGILIIAGERRVAPGYHDATIHRLEIPHGRFERRIGLPAGHFELGRRELAQGCLVLTLRKVR